MICAVSLPLSLSRRDLFFRRANTALQRATPALSLYDGTQVFLPVRPAELHSAVGGKGWCASELREAAG